MAAKIHRHLSGESRALEQESNAAQGLSDQDLEADKPCLNLRLAT